MEKIYNPKTSREITIDSPTYRRLLREGYTLEDGALVPPDTTDFVFSRAQNKWINRNSALFRRIQQEYDVQNQILVRREVDWVMGPNRRKIHINRRAYRALLRAGYTHDEERNILIYPVHIDTLDPGDTNNLPDGFGDAVRRHEYTHMVVMTDSGPITFQLGGRRLREIRDEWHTMIVYDNLDVISIELFRGGGEVRFGPAYGRDQTYEELFSDVDEEEYTSHQDEKVPSYTFVKKAPKLSESVEISETGKQRQNCVIKCLETHYLNHGYKFDFESLYKEYEEGVFQSDFEDLSKKLGIKITVVVGCKEFEYGKSRTKKAKITLYYHNNHVTDTKVAFEEKESIFVDQIDFQSFDFNKVTNIIAGKNSTYCVETTKRKFRLKKDEGIDLEQENVYSAISYYTREFLASNSALRKIQPNHDNIDAIKSIIQNGITFCNDRRGGLCIDLKKAYSNFENFEEYTGFPTDLCQCVEVDDMHSSDILDAINNHEGFALIEGLCIFGENAFSRWMSFPYVRHRLRLPSPYGNITIKYLMVSLGKTHLNMKIFENAPKRALHKVFGKLVARYKNNSFATSDPLVGESYGGSYIAKKETPLGMQYLFLCSNWVESISSRYYPHVTGYVHQYTEIQLEKKFLQLRELNIPVYRVWIDGITIPIESKIKFEKTPEDPLWHVKETKNTGFTSPLKLVTAELPLKKSHRWNALLSAREASQVPRNRFCIKGEAGTGKTTNLEKLFLQMSNAVILVPTHNLKRNYPGLNVETIHNFIARKAKSFEVLLIDEYSMISQQMLDSVTDISEKIVVLAGDTAQLKCAKGNPIDTDKFINIELTKNYRQKDKVFLENLKKTRETGDISWISKEVSVDEALVQKMYILMSTHENIDKVNKRGMEMNPNPEYKGVKVEVPVRFYKTKENYEAGDTGVVSEIRQKMDSVVIDIDNRDDSAELEITQVKDPKVLKPAYAMTIHGVQGKTIPDVGIAISTKNNFGGKNMRYVAVSRATSMDQLHILQD